MNNEELNNFRKIFYKKLEKHIYENDSLTEEIFNKILNRSILETNISNETSKNIMICLGTYAQEKREFSTKEFLTYDEDPRATYKLYEDIETGTLRKVPLEYISNFKEKYKTIDTQVKINNIQEYNKQYQKIKLEYFKNLLYDSQNVSLKLLLKENE